MSDTRTLGMACRCRKLPPGGGYWERFKPTLLWIVCLTPLGLVIIVQFGIVFMSDAGGSAAGIVGIAVGLVEVAVAGAQVVTLVGPARSSIVGDRIHLPGIVRTKRIMMFLSVPVLIAAVPVAVAQLVLMGLLGLVFNVFLFAIGALGLLGRFRLRTLEVFVARGGHGGAGRTPHGGGGTPPTPYQR